MMSPNRKATLKASAANLQRKADRALRFWGVRSALLSEAIKLPPHPDFIQYVRPLAKGQRYATPDEIAVLRMAGNPAIRMNDLFRVTNAEFRWLLGVAPSRITRWCRTLDYDPSMWWSDPDRPIDSRPVSIKENWNAARSLALTGERADEAPNNDVSEDEELSSPEEHSDDDIGDVVVARNQGEREDLAEEVELDRPNIVFGDDYWTDTQYPVLESQASFGARGSNDDLDDLYGEEPRDTRDATLMRIIKARGWRASRTEEQFQEAGIRAYHPTAHFLPSNACEELFGEQPAPVFNDAGKLKQGFFISRSEFFAQRDMMLQNMDDEYKPKPSKRRSPGALDLDLIRKADDKHRQSLPVAAPKPRLTRGQRWLKCAASS
jgi:hypothetical protein